MLQTPTFVVVRLRRTDTPQLLANNMLWFKSSKIPDSGVVASEPFVGGTIAYACPHLMGALTQVVK